MGDNIQPKAARTKHFLKIVPFSLLLFSLPPMRVTEQGGGSCLVSQCAAVSAVSAM